MSCATDSTILGSTKSTISTIANVYLSLLIEYQCHIVIVGVFVYGVFVWGFLLRLSSLLLFYDCYIVHNLSIFATAHRRQLYFFLIIRDGFV